MTDMPLALDEPQESDTGEIEASNELPDEVGEPETPENPEATQDKEPETPESEPPADEPPTDDAPPKPTEVPVAALQAERTKAQAARQEADALRQDIAALTEALKASQQPKAEPEAKPEPLDPDVIYTDPQKVVDHITKQFEQRLQAAEQSNQARLNDMAEANAIARYGSDEYKSALASFQDAAKQTPGLVEQLRSASDPAEFAYQQGRKHAALSKFENVDELEKQIEARVREKLLAELKDQREKAADDLQKVPDAISEKTTQARTPATKDEAQEMRLALD